MITLAQLATIAPEHIGDAVVSVLVALPDAFLRNTAQGVEVSVARGSRQAFPVMVGTGATVYSAVLDAQRRIWNNEGSAMQVRH